MRVKAVYSTDSDDNDTIVISEIRMMSNSQYETCYIYMHVHFSNCVYIIYCCTICMRTRLQFALTATQSVDTLLGGFLIVHYSSKFFDIFFCSS